MMKQQRYPRQTGHVGQRGTIVLPASTRKRYGLLDGSLYMSEEREDGILIRKAEAVPVALDGVRRKIREGLDQLNRGEGVSGKQVEAELKALSRRFRARKTK